MWPFPVDKSFRRLHGHKIVTDWLDWEPQRVGYSSASTFSVAFTRHVGRPPMQYAREAQAAANGA